MKKRKFLSILLVVIVIISGYFLTANAFPKNLNRYPGFILLLLIDYYVWGLIKKKVFTYSKLLKTAVVAFYWMPLIILIISTIAVAFQPSNNWNSWLRNIVYGSVFTFYVAKILMAVILLFADLLRLFKGLWKMATDNKKDETTDEAPALSRAGFLENLALITGGLVISSMFTGMFKWVHDFDLKTIKLKLSNLPSAFNGYKIVQISDLHLGGWANETSFAEAMQQINELEPDLIVFTGDLVNYRTDEAFRFRQMMASLRAKDGIYAILGNHDYGDYVNWPDRAEKKKNLDALVNLYHQTSWKLLRNENALITREGEKLALIGVENWGANPRFPQYGDVIKASKGLGNVPIKILLSHDPSHWNTLVTAEHTDIQLTLSGHTHGFQFGVEIPGIRWSPAQYIYKEWAGLYRHEKNEQYLYVNRGLGSIGYPGRIGILPEITLIELQTA